MTRSVERLTGGVQNLADLLSLTTPTLPTAASLSKSGLQIVESTSSFTVRDDGPVAGGIWDDEAERRFYEDLVDLNELVPASLLGVKEKPAKAAGQDCKASAAVVSTEAIEGAISSQEATKEMEAQKRDEEDIKRQLEQIDLEEQKPEQAVDMARTASNSTMGSPVPQAPIALAADEPDPPPSIDTTDFDGDGLQSAPAARLTALFAALPEASNREMVDKLAVEFAFLNSKAARNRLVKVSPRFCFPCPLELKL